MKFDSFDAYCERFVPLVPTVAGRAAAEAEIERGVSRLKRLRGEIEKSIERRNIEISQVHNALVAIRQDRSSYVINVLSFKKLTVQAVEDIQKKEADLASLWSRRGRLFGQEFQLDHCLQHIGRLLAATDTVLLDIRIKRSLHDANVEAKRRKKEATQAARAKALRPYRARIEAGQAALGQTRAVAASRKSGLSRKHPCPYCGGPLGDDPAADHIYPVARGGRSTPDNMVYVCRPCNQKKRHHTLMEFIHRHGLNADEIYARLMKQQKRF